MADRSNSGYVIKAGPTYAVFEQKADGLRFKGYTQHVHKATRFRRSNEAMDKLAECANTTVKHIVVLYRSCL